MNKPQSYLLQPFPLPVPTKEKIDLGKPVPATGVNAIFQDLVKETIQKTSKIAILFGEITTGRTQPHIAFITSSLWKELQRLKSKPDGLEYSLEAELVLSGSHCEHVSMMKSVQDQSELIGLAQRVTESTGLGLLRLEIKAFQRNSEATSRGCLSISMVKEFSPDKKTSLADLCELYFRQRDSKKINQHWRLFLEPLLKGLPQLHFFFDASTTTTSQVSDTSQTPTVSTLLSTLHTLYLFGRRVTPLGQPSLSSSLYNHLVEKDSLESALNNLIRERKGLESTLKVKREKLIEVEGLNSMHIKELQALESDVMQSEREMKATDQSILGLSQELATIDKNRRLLEQTKEDRLTRELKTEQKARAELTELRLLVIEAEERRQTARKEVGGLEIQLTQKKAVQSEQEELERTVRKVNQGLEELAMDAKRSVEKFKEDTLTKPLPMLTPVKVQNIYRPPSPPISPSLSISHIEHNYALMHKDRSLAALKKNLAQLEKDLRFKEERLQETRCKLKYWEDKELLLGKRTPIPAEVDPLLLEWQSIVPEQTGEDSKIKLKKECKYLKVKYTSVKTLYDWRQDQDAYCCTRTNEIAQTLRVLSSTIAEPLSSLALQTFPN